MSGGSISNQSFWIDKEKEAESNHATRQQKYDSSKEEIAARQAREAAIESHLQKVKQMEVAKLENRRIIQENINALVTNLSQNFQQILATMERQQLEIALSPYRYIIHVKLLNFLNRFKDQLILKQICPDNIYRINEKLFCQHVEFSF